VLISSEAGHIHCWSLYGERKDMGMFYGPSRKSESILGICTDVNNQYLICGDTHGELRVWNISNYCCSLTSPIQFDTKAPPLVHSWQAHSCPITFCEWTNYNGNGSFIMTASTDHTAHLWTIDGQEIGIFGQRPQWDIDNLMMSQRTNDSNQIPENNTTQKDDVAQS
jgi:WD40 repeat protein